MQPNVKPANNETQASDEMQHSGEKIFTPEDSLEQAKKIAHLLDDKKAENIVLIKLSDQSILTDYFVIASAISYIQLQALANYVHQFMAKQGFRQLNPLDTKEENPWLLLDYGFLVVHLFHQDKRDYYSLEKLWSEGESISI